MIRVEAPGKLNLALRVGSKRMDGYHPLNIVFQAVSVYDVLEAENAPEGVFELSVSGPQAHLVPTDDSNLAIKAARLLAGPGHGVRMRIAKEIPVTGGMAGGSADAAAALVACNELWGLGLGHLELLSLGKELGADVPFVVFGGTALGVDRGDELTEVPSRGRFHWALAFSDSELSTPAVFSEFDSLCPGSFEPPAVPQALLDALAAGDVYALADALQNDLQESALRLKPNLRSLMESRKLIGALAALVSGSGPTVAFLMRDEDAAQRAVTGLRALPGVRDAMAVYGPVAGAEIV
ncbi:MAG: 4-(cytidine 5'-diphospho)-2-C-methyl-D-erythritol kinase [Propionibacteriaceae bacterium]|jgi:4-diphosphocytidyl-2-C-methyl-D-erythritol kinase|nr:4-(cytidine 5'-diphospho)-2-C-methyl-D-erythritol kinase [Propionibacteriaceae bacterium]